MDYERAAPPRSAAVAAQLALAAWVTASLLLVVGCKGSGRGSPEPDRGAAEAGRHGIEAIVPLWNAPEPSSAAARTGGWLTELAVHNPGAAPARYEIALLEQGRADAEPRSLPFHLRPGSTVRYPDVQSDLFSFTAPAALRITTTAGEVLAVGRSRRQSGAGRHGRSVAGLPSTQAIAHGSEGRLVHLSHHGTVDSGLRSDVVFVNRGPQTIELEAELYRADGTGLDSWRSSLGPFALQRVVGIFNTVGEGELDAGYAVVRTVTPGGSFFAWASVVDGSSGDAGLIPAVDRASAAGEAVFFPEVVHGPGVAGFERRTELELHNPGDGEGRYEIALLRQDRDRTEPPTAVYTVAAGRSLRLHDLLPEAFSFSGSASLRIEALAGAVIASSRSYGPARDGGFGRFSLGVRESEAIKDDGHGILVVLPQGRSTGVGTRTELGLLSCAGSEVVVQADRYRSDTTFLGSRSYRLQPYAGRRDAGVLRRLTEGDADGGAVVLSSLTAGGCFFGWASEVDTATGDSSFIPAAVVSGGARPTPTPAPTPTVGPGVPMEPRSAMDRVFEWLGSEPGRGEVSELVEIVARYQDEGLEAMLDEVATARPEIATRTPMGLALDFGNQHIFDDGTLASGRIRMSFDELVNTPAEIFLVATLEHQRLQVDGEKPPVDRLEARVDLEVAPDGNVVGTVALTGIDAGSANRIDGSLRVDTRLCARYPVDGELVWTLAGSKHRFDFDADCDGAFEVAPPE